jgi:lysyl-tRNA synthetase class 2
MHGIADAEIKQRQRYVDLIGSSLQIKSEPGAVATGFQGASDRNPVATAPGSDLSTREVFERRAKIISSMRRFLEDHGYIEVETPMLTAKATGAAAKPFKTHHNALDIDLYARIAPELYLKRLVVGGFEKVYELNRNFRNEGISYKHNPEFTMLEFYCAYMDVEGMMNFCEELMRQSVQKATGGLTVNYEGHEIDFGKFERLTMGEAVVKYYPKEWLVGSDIDLTMQSLDDLGMLRRLAVYNEIEVNEFNKLGVSGWSDEQIAEDEQSARLQIERERPEYWLKTKVFESSNLTKTELAELGFPESFFEVFFTRFLGDLSDKERDRDNLIAKLFEMYVEKRLVQPTFVIDYPKSISPLSKASPQNPNIAERFELFINGMEVANGFSELNDPKEQYERFVEQMSERERGDEEAMVLDEDYIRALSYGMPPAAGIGIGIDRLVMLLTNKHSIRDVILFPHMRPERRDEEKGSGGEEEAG